MPPDVNFNNGDIADWNWIGDPIFGQAGAQFYTPMISDPVVSRTMFAGHRAHRLADQDLGHGTMTHRRGASDCNEWTGDFTGNAVTGRGSARPG